MNKDQALAEMQFILDGIQSDHEANPRQAISNLLDKYAFSTVEQSVPPQIDSIDTHECPVCLREGCACEAHCGNVATNRAREKTLTRARELTNQPLKHENTI